MGFSRNSPPVEDIHFQKLYPSGIPSKLSPPPGIFNCFFSFFPCNSIKIQTAQNSVILNGLFLENLNSIIFYFLIQRNIPRSSAAGGVSDEKRATINRIFLGKVWMSLTTSGWVISSTLIPLASRRKSPGNTLPVCPTGPSGDTE